ncbi:MAG: MlaD family protein, partial [Planctomycetota bacterium]|nr:MlaD family protein [Planctomycetota bacterium]
MDSTARLEMRIGLLVIAGVTALVVLILVSDRVSFDSSYRVTVYLQDAGGLNVGSPVKLAGINIGTVELIRPASDPRGQVQALV